MLSLLWALTAPVWADRPPEVGVVVNPLLAVDTQSDRPNEDQFTSWTWIRATARKPGTTGWFLEINGEHHVRAGDDV